MRKPISLEERVADLERALVNIKDGIDEQPARDAWLVEIEEQTPRRIFACLVTYLAKEHGLSTDDLREFTERIMLNFPPRTAENAPVFDHTEQRTRAIMDEMLP